MSLVKHNLPSNVPFATSNYPRALRNTETYVMPAHNVRGIRYSQTSFQSLTYPLRDDDVGTRPASFLRRSKAPFSSVTSYNNRVRSAHMIWQFWRRQEIAGWLSLHATSQQVTICCSRKLNWNERDPYSGFWICKKLSLLMAQSVKKQWGL